MIEAAVKLGIKKVVIASSETTYGICFSDGQTNPHSLPLEEDYAVNPMDSYGLSNPSLSTKISKPLILLLP